MSNTMPDPHGPGPRLEDLTWREFERAMAVAFEVQGYQATMTADGADGGVDLILRKPGEVILVQCKHWNAWTVGVKTVRELLGVMTVRQATGGIVATSGRFTDEARQFARQAGVTLLGRVEVVQMLKAAPLRFTDSPGSMSQQAPRMGGPRCPRCGELMALRIANRGPQRGQRFWGCPRFPHCRGVVPFADTPPTAGQPHPAPGLRVPHNRPVNRAGRTLLVVALVLVAAFVILPVLILGGAAVALSPVAQRVASQATPAYPSDQPGTTRPAATKSVDPRIVGSIGLDASPNRIAVDPELHRLYATVLEKNSLIIIDLAANKVLSNTTLDRQPGQIAVDTASHTLWITNYNDASVTVLNQEGKPVDLLQVGRGPSGVAIDVTLRKAYVANALDGSMSVIDTTTRKTTSTTSVTWSMADATVDTVQHKVCFVVTSLSNMGYCYDGRTLKAVGGFSAGGTSIAIDSVTHSQFGTTPSTRGINAFDAVTRKSSQISVGVAPTGVAVDPTTHLVYVADHDGKAIFAVKPF